jgi:hypothetical protein
MRLLEMADSVKQYGVLVSWRLVRSKTDAAMKWSQGIDEKRPVSLGYGNDAVYCARTGRRSGNDYYGG